MGQIANGWESTKKVTKIFVRWLTPRDITGFLFSWQIAGMWLNFTTPIQLAIMVVT